MTTAHPQPPLPFPPFAKTSATSLAAAVSMHPHTPSLRTRVLAFLRAAPDGATCDEIEQALGLAHQTASARVYELRKLGLIGGGAATRKTRSGRAAVVWFASDQAGTP